MSSRMSLSPRFSKNVPDLNLTSYFDLSNVSFDVATLLSTLRTKLIGWEMPLIVSTPSTSKSSPFFFEDVTSIVEDL